MRGHPCADPARSWHGGGQWCRIGVTDRAAPLWERRGSILGKPRPDARDPATCAGLNCANPTAPADDRECHCRGGSFLPLMRGMRAMMDACIHIEPGRSPGLPTRTGLLNAQPPPVSPPGGGFFMPARWRACRGVRVIDERDRPIEEVVADLEDSARDAAAAGPRGAPMLRLVT